MDFVKKEDQVAMDEESYKAYLDSLQKSHQQMETDYLNATISMEQLHQAMQSSLNNTIAHNFQLPLSPRQMSTLMFKSNPLSRNFNEIPAHLSRNLASELDLAQNLSQDLTMNLRHEDLILGRNLDLSLVRNLNNDLDTNMIQNLSEQDITRMNNELNRLAEIMPQLHRHDLPHNLTHELDLSHHLTRPNIEQELQLPNDRRTPVVHMQNQMLEQNLGTSITQRLNDHRMNDQRINDPRLMNSVPSVSITMHENQRMVEQNDHNILPMPFIKSELEDDGYFYDNVSPAVGNINGLNGQIPPEQSQIQQEQLYLYNHPMQNVPALNPIDLYTRQQYLQSYQTRDNPQNLVIQKQFDQPYQEDFKKFREDTVKNKEQPKENLKPTDQNKIFYPEFHNQNMFPTDNKSNDTESKLPITESEEPIMAIKGEYECYKCHTTFPSKRGLKIHAKSCLEGEGDEKLGKFACTQCAYRCQSPAILKIHERTHSGEKPFSCNFCDYKSGQKNNVAKHILVHMKEKPFQCQFCEYRCAQKNNLVVHERTHTGYKPFACPYCDYRTVQKPNLVKHMYLHTDQKPFSCDKCSYRCVQKTNLTKHKQRHMNENDEKVFSYDVKESKPYRPRQKSVKCPYCEYKCVQKSSLEKHMQYKHSGLPVEVYVSDGYSNSDKNFENSNSNGEVFANSTKDVLETDNYDNSEVRNIEGVGNEERCDESMNLSVKKDLVDKEPMQ